jgi:hypothetical protein
MMTATRGGYSVHRKNNLGRSDLPTLSFTIEPFPIEVDDGNDVAWTGRLGWGRSVGTFDP